MKTFLFALEFPPALGGVETYYASLAEHWPDEFVVVDNRDNGLVNERIFFMKWLPAFMKALRIAREAKPDWFLAGEILPIATALWLASYCVTLRYAVFLHGLDFSLATKSAWKRALTRRILNRAALIFCVNSHTAKLVEAFLGSNAKIRLAHPGIAPAVPSVRPEQLASIKENYNLKEATVLVSIGRLVKRKGIASVISVLPSILEKNPELRYVIIGRGKEESNLKEMINDPGLQGKVILLTNVSDEEKWTWLEAADIFIMPAKELPGGDYEGFGIVYLEANLFGKPVIAGRSGGVADAVVDRVNGLLVDPENLAEISEAIIRLASDKDLRLRLGQQGRERALKDFSWPDKVKEIYQTLILNL